MAHKNPLTDLERGYVHQCLRAGMDRSDIHYILMFHRLTGKPLSECHMVHMDIKLGVLQGGYNFGTEMHENLKFIGEARRDGTTPLHAKDNPHLLQEGNEI